MGKRKLPLSQKVRKGGVLFLILVMVSCQAFSLPSVSKAANGNDHNTDVGAVLYGVGSWKEMKKKDEKTLTSYYIMSDATYFAIDYPVGHRDDEYSQLQDNINRTDNEFVLPNLRELSVSTWGGNHRIYNHQGFYFNYEEAQGAGRLAVAFDVAEKRNERWLAGRDEVLIPAAAAAFGLQRNDPKAEIIALFAYYAHMIGDTFEGKTSDMQAIGNFRGLLIEFEKECELAFRKGNLRQPASLTGLFNALERHRLIISKLSSYANYSEIKNIFMSYVPSIIHDMGVSVTDIY